jgi:uncharacterized protein YcfJ
MRKTLFTLAATALALPTAVSFNVPDAGAKTYRRAPVSHYRNCRRSSGTTGLVAGGVGGAVVGNAVGGGLLGTVAGGVAGALGGRAIDRTITAKKRCYRR